MNARMTLYVGLKLLGLFFLINAGRSMLWPVASLFTLPPDSGMDSQMLLESLAYYLPGPVFEMVVGIGLMVTTGPILVLLGFVGPQETTESPLAAPNKAWYAGGLTVVALMTFMPAWNSFVSRITNNVLPSAPSLNADNTASILYGLGAWFYLAGPVLVLVFAWPLGSWLHQHHQRMLAADVEEDEE